MFFSFGDLNHPFRLCVSNYIDESPRTCVNTLVGLRGWWSMESLEEIHSFNSFFAELFNDNFAADDKLYNSIAQNSSQKLSISSKLESRNSTSCSSQTNFKVFVFCFTSKLSSSSYSITNSAEVFIMKMRKNCSPSLR